MVCFCKDALKKQDKSKVKAACYWNGTSSNDVIKEFLGFISSSDADDMQTLLDEGCVSKKVHDNMNHEDLKNHDSDDFWSLLAYTGYLTATKNCEFDIDHEPVELVIPNISVKECFKTNILEYFTKDKAQIAKVNDIVKAIFNGSEKNLRTAINDALSQYISIRDFSSNEPKESYYQGFLNGIFSIQKNI